MKRTILIFLLVSVLSVNAFAVDKSDYIVDMGDGTTYFNVDYYNAAVAAEKIAAAGLDLDADAFWAVDWLNNRYFDNDAFEAAYSAALEKQSAESVGNSDANNAGSMEESNDKYPIGSYVDVDGNVWSSDGELLSDGTTPATYALEDDTVSSDVLDTSDETLDESNEDSEIVYVVNDLRGSSDSASTSTFAVIDSSNSGLTFQDIWGDADTIQLIGVYKFGPACVSNINTFKITYSGYTTIAFNDGTATTSVYSDIYLDEGLIYVPVNGGFWIDDSFHFSADKPLSSLNKPTVTGLKSIISSIFGDYTPIYTTGSVTETVDNEVTTTLIDVVAEGAAGVDYAWCAGVLLFAVLLFCLMKLLGGILK